MKPLLSKEPTGPDIMNFVEESSYILGLVRLALDDFDGLLLSTTIRRAIRIAHLQGEAETAWRLTFDSKPLGGSKNALVREAKSLWPDEDYEQIRARHGRMLDEFMEDRKVAQVPKMIPGVTVPKDALRAGSVAEIEQRIEMFLKEAESAESPEDRLSVYALVAPDQEVLDRIRHRVFLILCRWERELSFSSVNQGIFERHRKRVDGLLATVAPDVLDQFNAAYRRVREGDVEARSQALTSCRRILKAVADQVYPATDSVVIGPDGKERKLGDEQYVNRLWQFMVEQAKRQTAANLSHAAIEDFGKRIDRLNDLSSKGVHDEVSHEEVDLCVIHTYLFAGEVLRIAAG